MSLYTLYNRSRKETKQHLYNVPKGVHMRFKPDFETLNGIHDSTERIALVEQFLNAYSNDDYTELNKRYPQLFGEYATGQSPDDVRVVCETMRRASEIYGLARADGELDISDMLSCGLSPVNFLLGDEAQASSFSLTYAQRIEAKNYLAWLLHAVAIVDSRFPGYHLTMRIHDGFLSDDTEIRPISEYGKLREDCSYILQQLITLHLADVATVAAVHDNAAVQPAQMAFSGISCLWLGLVERMSGGRAFRCEACDKPSVAYGERRRKRFCCEACRKWANNNPGKKRGHWYIEQR